MSKGCIIPKCISMQILKYHAVKERSINLRCTCLTAVACHCRGTRWPGGAGWPRTRSRGARVSPPRPPRHAAAAAARASGPLQTHSEQDGYNMAGGESDTMSRKKMPPFIMVLVEVKISILANLKFRLCL